MKNDINVKLLKCYLASKCVCISYNDNELVKKAVGVVNRIDYARDKILLFPKKEINIKNIISLEDI